MALRMHPQYSRHPMTSILQNPDHTSYPHSPRLCDPPPSFTSLCPPCRYSAIPFPMHSDGFRSLCHSFPCRLGLVSVSVVLFHNMPSKEPHLSDVIRTQTHSLLVPDSAVVPTGTSVCTQPWPLSLAAPRSRSVRSGPVTFGNRPVYSVTCHIHSSTARIDPLI